MEFFVGCGYDYAFDERIRTTGEFAFGDEFIIVAAHMAFKAERSAEAFYYIAVGRDVEYASR